MGYIYDGDAVGIPLRIGPYHQWLCVKGKEWGLAMVDLLLHQRPDFPTLFLCRV